MRKRKKNVEEGDDITFTTREDFTGTTHIFKQYCQENNIDISDALLEALTFWLKEKNVRIPSMEAGKPGEAAFEQIFLIYKDGCLLAHATKHTAGDMDASIFVSMLTVIQGFVKDSFRDESDTTLRRLEFGEKNIALSRSKGAQFYLALIYVGSDRIADEQTALLVRDIENRYKDVLRNWDGNLNNLQGARDVLLGHLS